MKVLLINSTCDHGSTGKICIGIKEAVEQDKNNIAKICFFNDNKSPNGVKCSSFLDQKLSAILSKITGFYGFFSVFNTLKLIREISTFRPDIINLHNIHDHSVNLAILFHYLNNKPYKILWTFHDCWAFTGYCFHFEKVSCNRWKTGCSSCMLSKTVSWFFDFSRTIFKLKKIIYLNSHFSIVTPSSWLKSCVTSSFLSNHSTEVIQNGIDLNIFKPTASDFRLKLGLIGKIVILGVAYEWTNSKGINLFNKLANILEENFKILLIGKASSIHINSSILQIQRTDNQEDLAKFYSMADIFLNPTYEDTFPTVNLEALACGTPVLTSKVGGCPETINGSSGMVLDSLEPEIIKSQIKTVLRSNIIKKECCLERAELFSKNNCFKKYADLFVKMSNE